MQQQHLLLMIKDKLPQLPESERKIADVILANPLEVIQMNATQLAEAADSSAAAVIRLCRSINVKGFTELKIQLSAQTPFLQEDVHTDISPNESLEQIKKKLLVNTNYVLENTSDQLDTEVVEAVADRLAACNSIYVYGLGASYIVAMDIKQKFTRLGKQVFCSQDLHELVASMAIADEGSVYLGISDSGEKQEGLVLMEVANQLGLTTISLTKNTPNSLSKLAELSLKTAKIMEPPLRSGATISLLSQLYAVSIVFYCFMTKQYDDNLISLERSLKATTELERILKDYNQLN
ncbi:MurR/RpiR family transcriptional regulator [Jeotgalibaca arthritidis]|nr:MurR/RpiR family transcriptional regulator [Jeotgalibaca arthritidis]